MLYNGWPHLWKYALYHKYNAKKDHHKMYITNIAYIQNLKNIFIYTFHNLNIIYKLKYFNVINILQIYFKCNILIIYFFKL